ncbi:unnamed protein product [Prorocentrum cordatum]|uniref:Choloylglycine hydrolase/NAAA C-terminal domain-containing protein n=1 Tax=Prorocentrum cordatum TaxID=2364126 RepID=A0ABN9YLG3_9DINO|nr:unnamed protein product [Polarella glacialis]
MVVAFVGLLDIQRMFSYFESANGRFSNRYGFVGLDAIADGHTDFVVSDGMNEAGLTLSLHTMRTAEYEDAEPGRTTLLINDVIPWALGQFSSVAEVAAGLENVSVVPFQGATQEDFVHWAIADAAGNSAVLEYVAGKRVLHRNDVRVMTNDPDFTWHLKNLNMYVGLSPQKPSGNAAITVNTEIGEVPQIWSLGFNLLGLPGDTSPASRFVRLFYLRQYAQLAEPATSVEDAIVLATGLLNTVFIPRGTVAPLNGFTDPLSYELTQFGLLKIPSQRKLLVRGYRNMGWREVDLSKLRWDQRRSIPVEDGTLGIQDVTGQLVAEPGELI